ncbi:MAG: AMP-binding protein, partial [Bifidobacteriaceae bacterium]|nr:AMP-binding protein [Bifidobacteriaceae bacterium]
MYKIKNIKPTDTNCTILQNRVRRMGDEKFITYKTKYRSWVSITANAFGKYVTSIAKGLIASGIKKGDKIGVMAHTSFEWVTIDFAAWTIGAIVVPIYETSSPKQIDFICNDAGIKLLFVENIEIYKNVKLALDNLKTVKKIRIFEENALDELQTLGESISASEVNNMQKKNKATDVATIVYTSGSTGRHKGVEIQHKAFLSVVYATNDALPELVQKPDSSFLLFLPLAHVFARFAVLAITEGTSLLALSGNINALLNDLRYIKPDYIIGVPRIFEKVYNAASQKAGAGVKGKIFSRAAETAIQYSKALDTQIGPSADLISKRLLYDNLVYKQIREVLGGKMFNAVCGGAALDPEIAHFFRGVGINVLEGYGLTEITAPAMCNRVNNNKIGTIGLPFKGVEVKIAPDDELLIKAPSAFKGYYKEPELTKEVFKNGWLATGDLAKVDNEGFIKLVGRKKDIIVTAGGKNVTPAPLEQIVQSNSLVSQCV